MTATQATPPEEFIDQVKDVLEHLYDFPYLQHHPLADQAQSGSPAASESAAQRLRCDLIGCIEKLSPGPDVPFRSPHARLYNVLHLHYVEGLTMQETAHELGISLRQSYRDLRRAEESIATLIWPRRLAAPTAPEPRAVNLSSLQAEVARLETNPRPVDARELVQQAKKAVEPLARQQAIAFRVDLPAEPVIVSTDQVVAHQVLVNLFSQAIKQAESGEVRLALLLADAVTALTIQYTPKPGAAGLTATNPVVEQLVERLKWKVLRRDQPESPQTVTVQMSSAGPTVLVVDDNEGLVELLQRYLTGRACRVTAAASGKEGLALALALQPDAIVLDVMMPEMDGWEFLQRLRARPPMARIPVIICSVFNDPELAYSLGASLVLPKPVSRDDVLAALQQLGVV